MNSIDAHIQQKISGHELPHNHLVNQVLKWLPCVTAVLAVPGHDKSQQLAKRLQIWGAAETVMGSVLAISTALVHRHRPDPFMKNDSFPSGHTAHSFLGAELMRGALAGGYPKLAYSGYAVAVTMAALRLLNRKHWFSDVVAGAVLGVAAAKAGRIIVNRRSSGGENNG